MQFVEESFFEIANSGNRMNVFPFSLPEISHNISSSRLPCVMMSATHSSNTQDSSACKD